MPVALEELRHPARRTARRPGVVDEGQLLLSGRAVHLSPFLGRPGSPGHDMYPAGGPYTIAGAQGHGAPCDCAGTIAADATRYETVAGSLMDPPQE